MGSTIRLEPRPSRLRCSFCHDRLAHRAVRCARCSTLAHRLCASEPGRCPTLSCPRVLWHEPTVPLRPRAWRRALARPIAASLLTLAGATLAAAGETKLADRIAARDREDARAEAHARARVAIEEPADEPVEAIAPTPSPPVAFGPAPEPVRTHSRAGPEDLEVEIMPAGSSISEKCPIRILLRNRGFEPFIVCGPVNRRFVSYTWTVRDERGEVVTSCDPGW